MTKKTGKKFLSDIKLHSDYLKWREDLGRYETWEEACEDIINGHRLKYKGIDIEEELASALESMKEMKILASQRSLQFRHKSLMKHNMKIFNCCTIHACRPKVFQEIFYMLLCGSGLGASLLRPFVYNLPKISLRTNGTKTFVIEDSIEGWADSLGVLMSSYFVDNQPFPEYANCKIRFDYSLIRPKGSFINGGFKAPGADGLKLALEKIELLIDKWIETKGNTIEPILAYDIICHASDSVLSGGLRRCLLANDDVFTKNGLIKIKDIEVGDEVLTHSGQYKKVINKINNNKRKTLKIVTNCGHYYSTPEHKWALAKNIDGEIEWKLAKDLVKGDTFIMNNQVIPGQETSLPHSEDFDVPDLDANMAWFIGYFLGNGSCSSRIRSDNGFEDNKFRVSMPTNYPDLESRLVKEFTKFTNKFYTHIKLNAIEISSSKGYLSKYFLKHFKQPNASIEIPLCIKLGTPQIRLAFLSGLLDSDGSVRNEVDSDNVGTGQISIVSTKYYNFARSVQSLISSLGIPSKLDTKTRKAKSTEYVVKTIDSTFRYNLLKQMLVYSTKLQTDYSFKEVSKDKHGLSYNINLATTPHQRRFVWQSNDYSSYNKVYNKNKIGNGFIPVNILSIEESTIEEVYDIEVDEDHSFFINGILTHNSALSMIVDPNDKEMIYAKTGNWRQINPQRARSNNSVLLIRKEVKKEEFENIVNLNKGDNDIGFVFANNYAQVFNPCFHGDTEVLTTNGFFSFKELIKKQNNGESIYLIQDGRMKGEIIDNKEVFSINLNNKFRETNLCGKIAITRKNAKIFELILENGFKVKCTDNHIFATTNGSKKLKELTELDNVLIFNSLMSSNDTAHSFSRVYSIKYYGIEDVYCLEENINRTLIANGIVAARCFEIGMTPINTQEELDDIPYSKLQEFCNKNIELFGSQQCNLVEINAEKIKNKEDFLRVCKDATILGTLQAGYTDFPYMTKATEEISKREALLGVSITGWMNNPKLFNKEWLNDGAETCKNINKLFSKKININQSARITTTKPSGNASVILGTSSGIHPEHSERYFRIMQINKESDVAKYLLESAPFLLEESVWSANNTDYVIFIPIINPSNGLFKSDMKGVKHLELIKFAQEEWVNKGKNEYLCISKSTNHNISNTVILDDKQKIIDYIWENKDSFTAVSFISDYGDKDFNQAPFTSVLTVEEIFKQYGHGALFASGLIVDGLHYFNNNLWEACDCILNQDIPISGTKEQVMLKKYWLQRAKKFAKNYFKGDLKQTVYCLKDVHLCHKWETINRQMKDIDFTKVLTKPEYKQVSDYAAVACSGGSCEITKI